MEICRRAKAYDSSQKKEAQQDTIFKVILAAELTVEGKSDGEKAKGTEQVTVNVDGLIMEVAKTPNGIPMTTRAGAVIAQDVLVVLLPGFQAVPV